MSSVTRQSTKIGARNGYACGCYGGLTGGLRCPPQGEFAVAARRWVRPFRDSFPDFTMQIADLVADGEKVAAHFRCSRPHLGK
jgi:hypothetical protein